MTSSTNTRSSIVQTLAQSFEPLRLPNMRLYLGGQVVSLLGTWMQVTAQSWVVWELSHTASALGIATMLGMIPFLLLGPWAGAIADRMDRRRLLIGLQVAALLLAVTLALLVQTGVVQLWHVYVLALLLGIVNALDMPTQQAFIGDLSGMSYVRKAVLLNATVVQVSRMLGPFLAGWVIGLLGVSPAFWLNAVSFVAVIGSLLLVRSVQVRKQSTANPLQDFVEGLRFIKTQPRLQDMILFTVLVSFFGMASIQIMPAFASNVLHGGADLLGMLLGASGAGALVGSLVVAPLAQSLRRIGVVIGVAVAWVGVWFIVFASSSWVPLSLAALFCTGMGVPLVITTATGLMQTLAPPDMRARLLSTLLMVSFGIQPIAALVIGFNADTLRAPAAVALNGLLLIFGAALLLIMRADLRRWVSGSARTA